jgi:nucleoside 2-deoxyribosyltransferase
MNLAIIGEVLIDYSIMQSSQDKMRHGGIMHAARGAFALAMNYSAFYFAPNFLDKSIQEFSTAHGGNFIKIGNIDGSPNLILIKDVKEVGDQGYELILRDERQYTYDQSDLKCEIEKGNFTDILLFSGGYDLEKICSDLDGVQCNIHIDISNDISNISILKELGRKFSTVYISTSSSIFIKICSGDVNKLVNLFNPYTSTIVFKENRGGSRFFNFVDEPFLIPSQTKPIVHSVGVGDNFDVAHIWAKERFLDIDSMNFASWVAAEYASTTFIDDYKKGVSRIKKMDIESLKQLGGVSLKWEERKNINIYIAAPDFDYVASDSIRLLEESLRYHNFSVRLPIKEHGQLTIESSKEQRKLTCFNDIELLEKCQIVIGVIVYDDPGTLLEIGYSIAKGKPTLIFDPDRKINNCILENLPQLVTDNLDKIISAVFKNATIVN